jgi:hypothetical protein
MGPLHLTLSLIRIPRLFLALFLVPVILSLVIVGLQFSLSALFLAGQEHGKTKTLENTFAGPKKPGWLRIALLGGTVPEQAKICYWDTDKRTGDLAPLDPSCFLERYDVVIDPAVFETTPLSKYQSYLNGSFTKIHVCKGCLTDLVLWKHNGEIRVDIRSFFALALIQGIDMSDDVRAGYSAAIDAKKEIEKATGERYLVFSGFQEGAPLSSVTLTFIIIVNICGLIITALWLAIKAHRKVLDYFSHSGALLPLVAACGARCFYSSVWLLTVLRVVAFLGAAVPIGIITFGSLISEKDEIFFFPNSTLTMTFWLISLVSCLALTTLIASIAELKAHHSLTSFKYKILPMLLCMIGGILWGLTFVFETGYSQYIRSFLTVLPVLGLAPIIMAPIFSPPLVSLIVHVALTTALFLFSLEKNSEWFAAHLDDI